MMNPVARQTARKRQFQLTTFNIAESSLLIAYLEGLTGWNYTVAGQETCPETGRLHQHIYVQYDRPVCLTYSKLHGAHVEDDIKGNPTQNRNYVLGIDCGKEGTIKVCEHGQMKQNVRHATTIGEVRGMTREEREELPINAFNVVNTINNMEAQTINVREWFKNGLKTYYIWGPSGIGKSRAALNLVIANGYDHFDCITYANGFWHGVSGSSEAAIYDEFRDSQLPVSEFIQLLDYNIHPMNVKFGSKMNRYKFIVITSIQDPSRLYGVAQERDGELRNQWMRRISFVEDMNPVFQMPRDNGPIADDDHQEEPNPRLAAQPAPEIPEGACDLPPDQEFQPGSGQI